MTARILGGRYQLQEAIGGGGMAIVYRAVDTLLDRVVAIKMLRAQFAEDEEFVLRFRQEAQAAARLAHPNIVNVYDVGVDEKEYYIVMEYVDGPTLKDVIIERAPLPVEEAIDISKQICNALSQAHEQHIVHRDIKPHNILLTKFGVVKVTDFGIARAVTGNTITDRQATSVLGSVHYFSPEQARGAKTDAKSDIYSLGVVMYEMLTGSLPFSGTSPVSVALKHLRERFIEPREMNKAIPQSLENIVLRCLVKSPDGRYADMNAVKADLADALKHPNVPKFQMPLEMNEDETIAVPVVGEGFSDVSTELRKSEKGKKWWKRALLYGGIAILAIAALGAGGYAAIEVVTRIVRVQNLALPSVVGKPEKKAVQTLEQAGFPADHISEKYAPNANKPKGTVYQQDPTGNTQVKKTREITLYVSQGAPKIKVPPVAGQPYDQAKESLVSAGFSADNISEHEQESTSVPDGQVISSSPAAGTKVASNGKIVLNVSVQKMTTVPNIVGESYSQAVQDLETAGLKIGKVTHNKISNMPDQTVYYVYPYLEGNSVPVGSTENLLVADNPGGSSTTPDNNTTTPDNSTGSNSTTPGDNTTTNTTTTGAGGTPQPHEVDVTVKRPHGQPVDLEITITDARGNNRVVVNQTLSETETFQETLYLAPGQSGDLQVSENGQVVKNYPVQG